MTSLEESLKNSNFVFKVLLDPLFLSENKLQKKKKNDNK